MRSDARTANNLRILMLEDLELDAELCQEELKRGGLTCNVRRVDNKEDFESALKQWAPTIILSDFSMPKFDGMRALDLARDASPGTPFIFVSGTIGEERAVEAMKRGATDYVLKHHMNRLVPVVKRALREHSEREAHRYTGRKLDETRARLDGVLGSLTDAVWSVPLSPTQTSYANAATAEVYDRPLSEFVADARFVLETVHPGDRERVETEWSKAADGGSIDMEHRIVLSSGEVRWLHVRAHGVLDEEGCLLRIDGISRNITRRRDAEERVARLSRVRAVLAGINAATVRVRDRQQLYTDACHIAVHEGGFGYAWVGDVTAGADSVVVKAHCCDAVSAPARSDSAPNTVASVPAHLLGAAIDSGKVALSNELTREFGGAGAYRSAAVVPLKLGESVVAVLVLFGAEAEFFGDQETKLLDELSGNLSFALDYMEKAKSLDYIAYYDALTGLPNRRLFFDRLAQLVAHAAAESRELSLMVVDLARFRSVNETYGTGAGDAVLLEIAQRLTGAVGGAVTCARITSDRFAIALDDHHSTSGAPLALEHVLQALDAPLSIGGAEVAVHARAGVSIYPHDGASPELLYANAEAALQNAKQSGGRLRFYAREMNARVAEMLRLESELTTAVREREFVLHYQPRVSLRTRRICGFEALIRWQNPARGMMPPVDFVRLLEESGLILKVGRWALEQAARDAATWHAAGVTVPAIGVNVSSVQLRESDFVEHVTSAIEAGGGHASSIELELTETVVMSDVEGNARKLLALRDAGLRIAVDDFGTGYSSLAYLARLPVDALKIDRSFVNAMHESPVQMAIVTTVISLARSLGLTAVAEGVESDAEAQVLASLRCDEAQGFLYSRPVPADEVPALMARLGTRAAASPPRVVERAAHGRAVSRLRRLLRR